MKKNFHTTIFPCLIAILGGANAGIRRLMYATAVDDKGLLTWNLPGMACLLLSLLAGALVVWSVWKTEASHRYSENFPPSLPGGICACLLAGGIAWTLGFDRQGLDILGKLRFWAGWASVPCLLLTAYGRIKGVRPIFLLHGAVCLFFGLNLADHYRIWSAVPQMADYIFELLASVGLMLTAYQRTAFDVGMGSRKGLLAASLPALYCCFSAVTLSEMPIFYALGGLWCLTGLLRRKADAS